MYIAASGLKTKCMELANFSGLMGLRTLETGKMERWTGSEFTLGGTEGSMKGCLPEI